jgi:hypothetical protein
VATLPSKTPINYGDPMPWPADQDPSTPAGAAQWLAASYVNSVAVQFAHNIAVAGQRAAIDAQTAAITAQTAQLALNGKASQAIADAEAAMAKAQQAGADAMVANGTALSASVKLETDRFVWEQARFAAASAPAPAPVPLPDPVPAPATVPAPTALHALVQALDDWLKLYPGA